MARDNLALLRNILNRIQFILLFFFLLKAGLYYVALAGTGLELFVQTRLALKAQGYSCFCLLSAGI